eukprot:g967.t1
MSNERKYTWDPAFLAQFKKPEWSWQCDVCLTWMTKKDVVACLSCGGVRKGYEAEYKKRQNEAKATNSSTPAAGGGFIMKFGGGQNDDGNKGNGMTFGTGSGGGSAPAGLSFGTNTTNNNDDASSSGTTSGELNFGVAPSATTPKPSSGGLNFGTTSTANDSDASSTFSMSFGTASQAPKTPQQLSFGTSGCSTSASGISFGLTTAVSTPLPAVALKFGTAPSTATKIRNAETKCIFSPSLPRSKKGIVRGDLCGDVYTWGSGDCDQLGHGKKNDGEEMVATKPTVVSMRSCKLASENICAVSCGGLHTAALTSNGGVLSWGCNDDETLGRVCDDHEARLVQFYQQFAPDKVASVSAVVQKYKGFYDTLYMRLYKKYGVFPGGESVPGYITLQVPSGRFVQVECGDCHTAALTEDGRVYTWGNSNGYIGYDKTGLKKQAFPKEVEGLFRNDGPMTQIACGSHHTCARSAKGLLFSWGDAEHGQIGARVPSRLKKEGLRVHTVGFRQLRLKKQDRRVERVFCHSYCTFAVLTNGKAYAWGLNNYGQLGTGDKENKTTPTLVLDGHDVSQVRGGLHHSIALTSKGHVFTTGRGDSGQLGLPSSDVVRGGNINWQRVATFDDKPVKVVASGLNHCLALTHGGELYSWGFGEMYQLGHGRDADENMPRRIESANDGREILWVSAGGQHSAMVAK